MNLLRFFKNLTDFDKKDLDVLNANTTPDRTFYTDYSLALRGEYMLGLAFGGKDTYATQRLALNAQDARFYFDSYLPFIAQWAILKNMPRILPEDYSIDSQTKGSAPSEARLNTREALEIARDHVINAYGRDNLENAIYIAHPAHLERVMAIGKKLDFRGVPIVDSQVVWNTGQENLNAGATISKEKWRVQELKARAHHLLKNWI